MLLCEVAKTMKLEVKRNSFGVLQHVSITNLSSREWTLMQIALKKWIEVEEVDLVRYTKLLTVQGNTVEETQELAELVKRIKSDLIDLKSTLDALTEKRS